MLIIKRLYSKPEVFDSIDFEEGFNLILGETTVGNVKTNGVGKSLAIEFINYALLKRHQDCRVSLIPEEHLSRDTTICLDFTIHSHSITSKRKISDHDCPTLVIDGEIKSYTRITDAIEHLGSLLFTETDYEMTPSFRSMMGPLIRDEGSEFKSIIQCFDTNKRIPPDYSPHLFLLRIDPTPYTKAKALSKEIDNVSKARKKMEENIVDLTGKTVSESKSDLNELENQVQKIQADIDQLENIEGYEAVKDEIIALETHIEQERSKQAVLKSELSKIKIFRGDNYIDGTELADLYNQFKDGLGDLIERELDEIVVFKRKIDNFQRTLIDGRRDLIERELETLDKSLIRLSMLYKEKINLLDQDGLLVSLKQTIAIHSQKVEEFSALSSFIQKHTDYDAEHRDRKREREAEIYLLESFVSNSTEVIDSFEQTVLDMHNYVFGNRRSSFQVCVSKRKEILNFELRTDSDGSHSINREKVFLYDLALLMNYETSLKHPGFLIHDNIFDVDQDTLIKSINFVGENAQQLNDKQYILTINSDKFGTSDLAALNINLADYARATFTKENKFLKVQYQEL